MTLFGPSLTVFMRWERYTENSHPLIDALKYSSKENGIPKTDLQQEFSVNDFLSDALRGICRGSVCFTRIP